MATKRGAAFDFPIPTQKVYEKAAVLKPSAALTASEAPRVQPAPPPPKPGVPPPLLPNATPEKKWVKKKVPILKKVTKAIRRPKKEFKGAKRESSSFFFPRWGMGRKGGTASQISDYADEAEDKEASPAPPSAPPSESKVQELPVPAAAEPAPMLASAAVESIGLKAAREAQRTISEQTLKIEMLRSEIQALRNEIGVNQNELLRRGQRVERLEGELRDLKKMAVPVEEVRELLNQTLRKGYSLQKLSHALEKSMQSKKSISIAILRLAQNAFGENAREYFRRKRRDQPLRDSIQASPVLSRIPAVTKQLVRLLRTEQLFLMEKNTELSAQLLAVREAMRTAPEKVAEVFYQLELARNLPETTTRWPSKRQASSVPTAWAPQPVEEGWRGVREVILFRKGDDYAVEKTLLANAVATSVALCSMDQLIQLQWLSITRNCIQRWFRITMDLGRLQKKASVAPSVHVVKAMVRIINAPVQRTLYCGLIRWFQWAREDTLFRIIERWERPFLPQPFLTQDYTARRSPLRRSGNCETITGVSPKSGWDSDLEQDNRCIPPLVHSLFYALRPAYYERLPSVTLWRHKHQG